MEDQAREPEAEERSKGVPPEWQVTVRRTLKEDGRYLIYYDFAPGTTAPEIELQPAATPSEERR